VIDGFSKDLPEVEKGRSENKNTELIIFEKGVNISYATYGMTFIS